MTDSPQRQESILGKRTSKDWVAQYAASHQHPFNRFCHIVGIPMITVSIPLFVIALFFGNWWIVPAILFVTGWILQFAGHAVERKPPEFFSDWRFLLVGIRWWYCKIRGRI